MQNRIFQNTCNQLRLDIERRIGIMDDGGAVIACSDETKIGKINERIEEVCPNNEIKAYEGYTYKKIETTGTIIETGYVS